MKFKLTKAQIKVLLPPESLMRDHQVGAKTGLSTALLQQNVFLQLKAHSQCINTNLSTALLQQNVFLQLKAHSQCINTSLSAAHTAQKCIPAAYSALLIHKSPACATTALLQLKEWCEDQKLLKAA